MDVLVCAHAGVTMTRLNPSIDEMAHDAHGMAGEAWESLFTRMLAAYGWRVKRRGGVIRSKRGIALSDQWEIVR
jgi:hypothetical protein